MILVHVTAVTADPSAEVDFLRETFTEECEANAFAKAAEWRQSPDHWDVSIHWTDTSDERSSTY
jgi:hypothetical protein